MSLTSVYKPIVFSFLLFPILVLSEDLVFYNSNCFVIKYLNANESNKVKTSKELVVDPENKCTRERQDLHLAKDLVLSYFKYQTNHKLSRSAGDYYQTEIVLLAKDQGEVIFMAESESSVASFQKPIIIKNDYGKFVLIELLYSGTGSFRNYHLFKIENGKIIEVDTDNLLEGVEIPEGKGIWKGPIVDFKNMELITPVWKNDDANCCPSAGTLHVKYKYLNSEIVVDWFNYQPDKQF